MYNIVINYNTLILYYTKSTIYLFYFTLFLSNISNYLLGEENLKNTFYIDYI